ncbi:MAG: YiiX/YebB-like N1pC/P60 family cysteine hydrolase [Mariprofundaceae bacterium]|nr:YiiX/YebB-like N1pC/P60 family cysteine hydrolase [Mariprofundaceae bacterium]
MHQFDSIEMKGRKALDHLGYESSIMPDMEISELSEAQFRMGAIAAAHPKLLKRLQAFTTAVRQRVVTLAHRWQADTQHIQQALYRLIYGGRAAVEEAWIQSGSAALPELIHLAQVASESPSVVIHGVRVHSGDILLSRAGAPTSALISRGNDYHGNFSHVAMAYVDNSTHEGSVIEAHIEAGTVISSVDQYFEDKKQRILVLRMREGHPKLTGNPDLAHDAAASMYKRVAEKRIPYDFAMNFKNDRKLFCSEVPFHGYRGQGVDLWKIKTVMSSPGLRRWLADMGVRYFETLAPSDVDYDPQLVAVAEWRDLEVLKADRIDNAIMDVLLEEAEKGLSLGYPKYKMPLAGVVKLWSRVQALLGFDRAIPKGMGTTTALKVNALMEKVFPLLRERLVKAEAAFRERRGYLPPYWSLLELADGIVHGSLAELKPYLIRE